MNRNIRLGQLLSPFGIGQLVNFPNDETLMICGLDSWEGVLDQKIQNVGPEYVDITEFEIHEPRLERLLNVDHFKKPFPFRESNRINSKLTIPAVRFPQWHYCIRCKVMRKVELTRQENPRCSENNCNGRLIPVRFVAVCPQGHIQDVPFMAWVHQGERPEGNHVLSFKAGKGSGDLSSIAIECSCGDRRTLGGIMNDGALDNIMTCEGHRPWLGPVGIAQPQSCENSLRVLIRGGSNVHYAAIRSALYLPNTGVTTPDKVVRIIERNETLIKQFSELDNDLRSLRIFLRNQPEVNSGIMDLEDLVQHVTEYLDSAVEDELEVISELDIRIQEYIYLNSGRDSENSDFKAIVSQFSDTETGDFLSQFFEHIVLIEKLKETRVFAGFSRISSEDGRSIFDKMADLSTNVVNWLPAHVVYGEGIFIKFRDDKIDEWLSRAPNEINELMTRYHRERLRRWNGYEERDLSPTFVLIHTFAHLLINRLCFNCGYGSSSLRERIYFSSDEQTRMNGVLIYTSSGDSEGSMGGLVRQGRESNFYDLLKEIIEDARWCSADPVCMDIGTSNGQGPDSLNGAACHNCAIVPDTSCEEFNQLLDRSCLIGKHGQPDQGFFN